MLVYCLTRYPMDTNLTTLTRNVGKTIWQGYSPDMSDADIRAAYQRKYGVLPMEVLRQASIVLCGPVNEIAQEGPVKALDDEIPVWDTLSTTQAQDG